MTMNKVLKTVSVLSMIAWLLSGLLVIVHPNLKAMQINLGETLGVVTLYTFALAWMLPFFLLIDKRA
jgi:hypothetical protein